MPVPVVRGQKPGRAVGGAVGGWHGIRSLSVAVPQDAGYPPSSTPLIYWGPHPPVGDRSRKGQGDTRRDEQRASENPVRTRQPCGPSSRAEAGTQVPDGVTEGGPKLRLQPREPRHGQVDSASGGKAACPAGRHDAGQLSCAQGTGREAQAGWSGAGSGGLRTGHHRAALLMASYKDWCPWAGQLDVSPTAATDLGNAPGRLPQTAGASLRL